MFKMQCVCVENLTKDYSMSEGEMVSVPFPTPRFNSGVIGDLLPGHARL